MVHLPRFAGLVPPADAPERVRDDARNDWLPLVKGVARHLLAEHDGEKVTLTLVEHFLPGPDEVIAGTTEPDTLTPLGTFAREGLASAKAVAEGGPSR